MNHITFPLLIICLLLLYGSIKKNRRITAAHNARKNKGDFNDMKRLAQRFIGKECLVYTMISESNCIKGTLTEVSDSALLMDCNGNLQAVNLEYTVRIREWPRDAKGRKKSFFAD